MRAGWTTTHVACARAIEHARTSKFTDWNRCQNTKQYQTDQLLKINPQTQEAEMPDCSLQ